MLKNVISACQNSGELKALQVALDRHITTGGWMPEGFRRKYSSPLPPAQVRTLRLQAKPGASFAEVDAANCRKADLTLILRHADASNSRSSLRRRERVLRYVGTPERVKEAYVSQTEVPSIRLFIYRRQVEVISIVCLQDADADRADDATAGDLVAELCEALFDSLKEITDRNAQVIWPERKRKRNLRRALATRFVETGDEAFLPAALEFSEHCILKKLRQFRVDPLRSRQIYERARAATAESLRARIGSRLPRNAAKVFVQTYQAHTVLALNSCVPRLLTDRQAAAASAGRVSDRTLRSIHSKLSRVLVPLDASADGVHLPLRRVSQIISETHLRRDRVLRTWLLLTVGGAWQASSPSGRALLNRLTVSLQHQNRQFHAEELNTRFEGVTHAVTDQQATQEYRGWAAVRQIGSHIGHSWRGIQERGPFTDLIQVQEHEQLAAELFYFVDRFCHDESLWTREQVAGFAHGLCWLCGSQEAEWRDWFFLPPVG